MQAVNFNCEHVVLVAEQAAVVEFFAGGVDVGVDAGYGAGHVDCHFQVGDHFFAGDFAADLVGGSLDVRWY